MTASLITAPEPSFLFQAGPEDLPAALAQARQTPASGLVVTGSELRDLAALAAANPNVPLVVDSGDWRREFASVERPLARIDSGGLVPLTLDACVGGLASLGAYRVLSPTLTIKGEDWRAILTSVLSALDRGTHHALLPYLPVHSQVLNKDNLEVLRRLLTAFGRPVVMTFLGGVDSMAGGVKAWRQRGVVRRLLGG